MKLRYFKESIELWHWNALSHILMLILNWFRGYKVQQLYWNSVHINKYIDSLTCACIKSEVRDHSYKSHCSWKVRELSKTW